MSLVASKVDYFDYVIVGAGAAGCVLAARLAEDTGKQICLLEAGPEDVHPFLHVPAGFIKMLYNEKYTWQFSTEPAQDTNNRVISLPQGRTLGGSTAISGMVYNRGQREDFDHWEALGNHGWGYESVLPYFQRSETYFGPGQEEFRGRKGPLKVTANDWIHPICEAFIQGASEFGIHANADYNGDTQAGIGYYQRNIFKGRRVSSSTAFLRNAMRNGNLHVRTNSQAVKIIFDGRIATGIQYVRSDAPDKIETARARIEVIVCAGAINTPKLLQLSGIGPALTLSDLQIPVIMDLPGVGENLRDHFAVRVVAKTRNAITINELARPPRLWWEVLKWTIGKPSILAICPSVVHFHWRSDGRLGRPDLQGVFSPASYRKGRVGVLDDYSGMTSGIWQHRPESSGKVTIRSKDPLMKPMINPCYLKQENDQRVMLGGVRLARELLRSTGLAPYYLAETLPGVNFTSDNELLNYIREVGVSSYHLNGTAKMGPVNDGMAVVDAKLRVHGLRALRIADASVFPSIPSANTAAATIMVAEKAAHFIKSMAQ